jgi:uncharacterized protein (TIGR02246 family)
VSDEERIRQLLARFIQLRDDHRFDEWSELFTEDGVFQYGTNRLTGRDAIRDHVSTLLAEDRGKHLCLNSIIEIDGDRATVHSDVVKIDPTSPPEPPAFQIRTMGRYEDQLVRKGEDWKFVERRVQVMLPGGGRV